MQFSNEQQQAFNKYKEGKNIFISGPGGTGKSALIRYIEKDAVKSGKDIQVCALTGCAAVLLECKAKTIHSWAGIGIANGTIDQILDKVKRKTVSKALWKCIDILVIDEISMMSQKLFEVLDIVGKKIRKNSNPFGGIQLIFSGDFFQLPPVGNKEEIDTCKFCFESPLWFTTFPTENTVLLKTIFRQTDTQYQNLLNQIREGKLKKSYHTLLQNQVNKTLPINSIIQPTKLFPTRNKVDYINNTQMNELVGNEFSFKIKHHLDLEMNAQDRLTRLSFNKEQIETELLYLQGNLKCDPEIKLKIGCQVMCIANIELTNGDTLCNGAQGIIIGVNDQNLPIVKFRNGYQMAMSYHLWPSEMIPGVGVSQIPLMLAWALTIHKAQGITLDLAEIDVGSGIFECGQTYVALSRVKSLEGLYLTSFDVKKIKVNKKVQEFYELLETQKLSNQFSLQSLNIKDVEMDVVQTLANINPEIPIVKAILIEEAQLITKVNKIY
jgi:ATP-dependent DNA helicase PIF1